MKVFLCIPYNPLEEVGGLELSTIRHAQQLSKRGVQTLVVSCGKSGVYGGVNIKGFNNFKEMCDFLLVNSAKGDVVHWLEIFPDEGDVELQSSTSLKLKDKNRSVIWMIATSGNVEKRGSNSMIDSADSFVISNPEQLIELEKRGITKNVYIIGFGIDTDVFSPITIEEITNKRKELGLPTDKFLLLFVGRFVERKRPDLLLEAWSRLPDIYNKAELVIVGSGMDQDDSIEGKVLDLVKSSRNVIFRDITKTPEDYYRICDLLVLPSDREGQPNVLMEMMSCGGAVLASDIPGINEVLHDNVNGLLFKVDEPESFVKLIRDSVSDIDYVKKLGQKARETILNERSIEKVTDMYLELYNKTLKSKL